MRLPIHGLERRPLSTALILSRVVTLVGLLPILHISFATIILPRRAGLTLVQRK